MVKGDLVKLNNIIKWILQTSGGSDRTEISDSFEIRNRRCKFLFYYGSNYAYGELSSIPVSLLIDFDEKYKFNLPLDITVRVSSTSKIFSLEKCTLPGDHKQVIWSSFDNGFRKSLLTFEMVLPENEKPVQTSPYIDTHFSLERASKDFARLLDEGPNYDVEFSVGEQTIKAHKNILCCRSDVFTSMLRSDMLEGKTGRVNIEDMNATIFQQFLRYLYTGMLPELTVDIAVQLYTAGDKYAVDILKLQCADFLVANLSPEIACEILALADRHNDPEFKKGVMEYLFKEKIPVVGEKWPDFCNNNQKLAIEVLNLYCKQISQNENFQIFDN